MTLIHGDCIAEMQKLPDNSIDSVVTDPPYELGFMGKAWDSTSIANSVPMWKEVFRVLKPGGHLLSFGGSRTYHRMASAVEDAGFEIRDQIMWVYGSGFPKSMDVSKAIDKAAGAEREVVGVVDTRATFDGRERKSQAINTNWRSTEGREDVRDLSKKILSSPSTEPAKQWDGWGTALKPAHEPIVVARKPLIGTVVANVLKHGTGAINIGASLVGTEAVPSNQLEEWSGFGELKRPAYTQTMNVGRWPANLIHDGSDEVEEGFPSTTRGGGNKSRKGDTAHNTCFGTYTAPPPDIRVVDTGSASRFFYCAKANKKDREEGNTHPTVKPTDLMRYLVRLVTPPSGTVLDPFTGSGSTGKAAVLEGFNFIGIEQDAAYIEIARKRIKESSEKVLDKLANIN